MRLELKLIHTKNSIKIFFFFLDNDPYEVKIENPEMLIANPISDSPLPVFYIGLEPPG